MITFTRSILAGAALGAMLHLVHRAVGERDQIGIAPLPPRPQQRDADREADLLVRLRREALQRRCRRCQLLPAPQHFSAIDRIHPGGELIAAQPRHQVAGAKGTAQQLLATGFRRIGTSESFNNRNEMGLSALIKEHGSEVGATMVIFSITPGKLTSAKRCADGRIDVKALRADPPASLSPRSYYLLQTSYFAPAAQSPA